MGIRLLLEQEWTMRSFALQRRRMFGVHDKKIVWSTTRHVKVKSLYKAYLRLLQRNKLNLEWDMKFSGLTHVCMTRTAKSKKIDRSHS